MDAVSKEDLSNSETELQERIDYLRAIYVN